MGNKIKESVNLENTNMYLYAEEVADKMDEDIWKTYVKEYMETEEERFWIKELYRRKLQKEIAAEVLSIALSLFLKKRMFVEGDWAAYNWLDEEGNDNWKVGRIVSTISGLMYFCNDGTERSGYVPISKGVKILKK